MKRFTAASPVSRHCCWLLLLLLLVAPPLPLAASHEATGKERIGAVGYPDAHLARGGSMFELLHGLAGDTRSNVDRSGDAGCAAPLGFQPAGARAAASVSVLLPLVRVVAPLCERLPYHATAPPSSR